MSTTVNQNFENAKKCFEDELEQIISSGILPVDIQTSAADKTITAESLRSEFDHCLNEMFTIAVCGEVKAGKSTLLNSLIFEDEVLPSFVTPETAKLTFIRESKKEINYFTVNWYSKSEWNEMKSSLPEENLKALDERLEYSASKDVTLFNCVGESPIDVDDLGRLAEYTSVPKEGEQNPNVGVYTPFVKNVEIYIKSDKLKNLQIVDTPGLNDPNRINSNETTKWINQAHAIIYVFPVRGLGSSDLEFFKTFMPAKTLNTRILVQNRIDENKDYKHATAGYSDEPAYKAVGLFVTGEVLCPYSAQVNLAQKKKKHNKASVRDEKILRRFPDFISDPNNLAKQVSDRLYKNSGYARIESLSNICCSVYSGKVKKIQESINLLNFKLDQYKRPLEEIRDKLRIVRND
ncbi:dynamin family protein [Fibrobacter sp.]|uniref:dynamin family protein n=1 Tax=Fibrobacter sp. TaxID=35828 RepID=UPI00262D58FC|nr:dynamin family protein [Fibrobacter sp.]MDD5941100.1 dynamin family protein [Fibrobacter sp.]